MRVPEPTDGADERLEVTYPTDWTYTLFVEEEEALRRAVEEIASPHAYTLTFSNRSRSGRFLSFQLVVTVPSEEERLRVFHELGEHEAVRTLL